MKLGLLGTAAATAATLAVTSAPPAIAATPKELNQQIMLAGPLVGLLPLFGITSAGPISIPPVDLILPDGANLNLNFSTIAYDTQSIYNTINAMPFQRRKGALGSNAAFWDRVYATSGPTANQFPAVLSSGIGSLNAIKMLRAQISSAQGSTPNGFTPFQPSAQGNAIPNTTNQELLLLRNPLRPNGGIMTRFAPILNLFGVDTTIPDAGVTPNTTPGIRLNTGQVDASWAYDPFSDFPVTLNPFALANSFLAGLPTNLLGGQSLVITNQDGTIPNDLTLDVLVPLAGTLGLINQVLNGFGVTDGKRFYVTLAPNDLPILEPLRLPARILNAIFGLDLGTPLADALQPALTILVNTGYSDVITPADAPNDPSKWYTRTYTTSNVAQPFLSTSPLTPAEWLQVPGDVLQALITGFRDVLVPPAPQTPPASVINPAAATVLNVTPAPALLAQSPAEVADEPAADVTVAVQADATAAPVAATADVDAPAPAVSPRRARGPAAPAQAQAPAEAPASNQAQAQAPASSEAAQPRAGAARQSARQGDDAPAAKRVSARSAATD